MDQGFHKIKITYDKKTTEELAEVQIKEIQIRGTSYANHECKICYNGISSVGSDNCFACEAGTYLLERTCKECPIGYYSLPNSISEKDCFKVEMCSSRDYHYIYSDCNLGLVEKTYE